MATHSSTLAWKTPWTEELGGLQPTGSQRVGHDWVPEHSTHKLPAQCFPVWLRVQTRCPPRLWREDASCFKSHWCSHIFLTLFFSTRASHLSVIPSFSLSAETLPHSLKHSQFLSRFKEILPITPLALHVPVSPVPLKQVYGKMILFLSTVSLFLGPWPHLTPWL